MLRHLLSLGNPGLADFYIPFLSEIYEKQTSTNIAILAHAHLDHAPQVLNIGHSRYPPSLSLAVQIETSLEVLDSILCNYTEKTRIVVIGHSVGAWISVQVGNLQPDLVPLRLT